MSQVQPAAGFLNKLEERLRKPRRTLSQEQLHGELNYWRSRSILQKMLDRGLITSEEFSKIDTLNRKSFSPELAQIMA